MHSSKAARRVHRCYAYKISLGNFSATNAEYLTRLELRNMYMTLLGFDDKDYLDLKVQTLKNLETFLSAEETKMVKSNSECEHLVIHSQIVDDKKQ